MDNKIYQKKYKMGQISISMSILAFILIIFMVINILKSMPRIVREPSAGYLVFEMNVRNLMFLFPITLVSLVGLFTSIISLIKKNTTLLTKAGLILNLLSIALVLIYTFFGDWINKLLIGLY